ncbi:MAG: hypothetical protein EAZ08_10020 [Cytophagales bacterium]|nr:MAG: hypothetical protein EAZ08_10020 [Cytophagales bacterium]
MILKIKLVISSFCIIFNISAQQTTLIGRIANESNVSLPYVSVFLLNKVNNGTFTDKDGVFKLNVYPEDTLCISHIGYTSVKISVNDIGKTLLLKPNVLYLKETTIRSKKLKSFSKKIGLNSEKVSGMFCGMDKYAMFVKNPLYREGSIKSMYCKVYHAKDSKFKNLNIQLRVRIYSKNKINPYPNKDILQENIPIIIKYNQNNLAIDLSKYNIPFLKEGVFIGLDIIGYIDKEGNLIQNSLVDCRKNLCIKFTSQGKEGFLTYNAHLYKLSWNLVSNLLRKNSNPVNAMLGVQVIFEED